MADLDRVMQAAPGVPDLFDLTGKVALVVGGTKGIGQAMALALAACGAGVCVASRGPAGLSETAEAICGLGRKGTSYAVDATDEAQVEDLFAFVVETYGKLDILVNSQGINVLQPTVDLDVSKWQRVLDVNLKSLILCCKYAARIMLDRGEGKIINVSSVRGFQGRAGDVGYAPSKGAVNNLTHSLAIEWGNKGIRVNAIAPAFTRTAMSAPYFEDPEKLAWVLSRIPMDRTGELEDFFGPVVFLASDASSFVNGHVLPVDGGWLGA